MSLHEKVNDDIYVSKMEGMSLVSYVKVSSFVCNERHTQPCTNCEGKIKVAEYVLQHGYIKLSDAFKMCSPHVTKYSAKDARRKLLQLPLAAIGAGDPKNGTYALYLVKKDNNASLSLLQSLLNKLLDASHKNDSSQNITKEEVKRLLDLAESESEKERLKYSIVKSSGLSSSKAKQWYGFQDVNRRIVKVQDAAEKAHNIRVAIERIARIKEQALVEALGIALSSEGETSESESEEESENPESTSEIIQSKTSSVLENSAFSASVKVSEGENFSCGSGTADGNCELDQKNGAKLLDILRKCDLNWLQFKSVARESMKGVPSETFEKMVACFYDGLLSFGVSELEANIVRQSYRVYEISKSQIDREIDIEEGNIISESDESSSDFDPRSLDGLTSPFDSEGQVLIKKRRAALRRKATREAKKRIAEERLLKRRKSKKVSRIIQDCPDIGKTIEDFI